LFIYTKTFVNLLVQVYKGTSTGGGVIQAKGLVGTREVQTKAASPSCICNKSSIRVFLSTTKMPSAVKCNRPHKVAICPSKKLYATRGTSTPSKYSSQLGGNCLKRNLIESINKDSKYLNRKEAEWGWRLILVQRLMGGRTALVFTQMLWKMSAQNRVTKKIGWVSRSGI